jgi:DNA-binding PadR family transcriptional regulator
MKHRDRAGRDREAHGRHRLGHRRHDDNNDHRREGSDERHGGHQRHRGRHRWHGERGGRPFDYGELRLLVLSMIEEQPRHGYELMRAIEERMGGSYSPSPGVIYPTLAWLEDMGYARVEASGGRKSYAITEEGKAFLTANRAAIDDMQTRMGARSSEGGRHDGVPAPVVRGMENLKLALRLRLRRGPLEKAAAEQIAAALDAAAQAIERS